MNIFEQAIRTGTRLEVTGIGSISLEQLYAAKASRNLVTALEDYEETLTANIEKLGKKIRGKNSNNTAVRQKMELQLAIVTNYLDELEVEKEAAAKAKEVKEREQYLLGLLQQKKQQKDGEKTIEELELELNNLRKL